MIVLSSFISGERRKYKPTHDKIILQTLYYNLQVVIVYCLQKTVKYVCLFKGSFRKGDVSPPSSFGVFWVSYFNRKYFLCPKEIIAAAER